MFNVKQFDVKKFDAILARGLSHGMGSQNGQMCIEAAICNVLGMEHSDDPKCVAKAVRSFKISLNDRSWSSPAARAEGLRDLGLAQLGSLGVIDDREFVKKLAEKLIRVMIPTLIRDLWATDADLMAVADECEKEGARESALKARDLLRKKSAAAYAAAAYAADAAYAYAADAAYAYAYAYAADAAYASYAADAARDKYLLLGAKCALDVLIELKSPGCELLGVGDAIS